MTSAVLPGLLFVALCAQASAQENTQPLSAAVQEFALPLNLPSQENTLPLSVAAQHLVHEPARPDTTAFRTAAIVTIAGNVFDGITTIAGMSSGGVRETNPVLGQHPGRIMVLKALLVVPVLLAEKRLVDKGHPKLARFMGYAVGGFATALGIHNIRASR